MTDVHSQIDHLKEQIDVGAEETKEYLTKLKKRIEEFDSKHKLSETATSYLESGIDTAISSADELKHSSATLRHQSKNASDDAIQTAQKALRSVKESLHVVQDKAKEYDDKFASSTGSSIAGGVQNVVNMTRQRTMDAIEMANEQAMRVREMIQNVAAGAKHGAQVATGEAVKVGQKVDEKTGASSKVGSAVEGLTSTIKNLDERMHVTQTAVKIDEKVTGGLGAKVVHKGVEMVQESVEYVTETLQHAKMVADQSTMAQKAESQVSSVTDTASSMVGAVGEKGSDITSQVKGAFKAADTAMAAGGTAHSAKEKAMETGSEMKEGVKSAVGSSSDKGSGMMESVKEGGEQLKEKAQEKGGQMMEGGQQMKENVKEKGSEMAQGAKQTGHHAKEKGKEMMGSTKQKGSEMMQGESEDQSMLDKAKQTASDIGTAAKEATMGRSSGESATDVKHKGSTHATASSATKTAERLKEKVADTMSTKKEIMKDATKP